jgi:hypothetical protein
MSRGSYARTALFTVTTPPDFLPQRAWDVPETFTDAKLYAKSLPVHEARNFARLWNTRQVRLCRRDEWDHTWLIVSSCCKQGKKWYDDQADPAEAGQPAPVDAKANAEEEGGAA